MKTPGKKKCGLTLDEIRVRQAVNELKIEIEKGKLKNSFLHQKTEVEESDDLFSSIWDSSLQVMTTASSVIETIGSIKNLLNKFYNFNK